MEVTYAIYFPVPLTFDANQTPGYLLPSLSCYVNYTNTNVSSLLLKYNFLLSELDTHVSA